MKISMGELMAILKRFLNVPRGNHFFRAGACQILAVVLGMGLYQPGPASAAPDSPVISGSTATFKGDQHLGIQGSNTSISTPPNDFSTATIYTIDIGNLTKDITSFMPYTAGIYMFYVGIDGDGVDDDDDEGPAGGTGGTGKSLTINYDGGQFALQSAEYETVYFSSQGGDGGMAGKKTSAGGETGHTGGKGGQGGDLTFKSTSGTIKFQGETGDGLYIESTGGNGGQGGLVHAGLGNGTGGVGGQGGAGGKITVESSSPITVSGGPGILADSAGGDGGRGGEGDATKGVGGVGGQGGAGGNVAVTSKADIITTTTPTSATGLHGIYALSQAGNAGKGGQGSGVDGEGGAGGAGGAAGEVTVTNEAGIATSGSQSMGILAQSIGGAGGDGGDNGHSIFGGGGGSSASGIGGHVKVTSSGTIQTTGDASQGIFAQSVGGFAGSGGDAHGLFTWGANGESGGGGGLTEIDNTGIVKTSGKDSDALFAQSVGGGGGSGGSAGGLFSMGGEGQAGGKGGTVTVLNSGNLQTTNDNANGIFAQSVGGGGGNGGGSISGSIGFTVAMGGDGGTGGDGGSVSVKPSNWAVTSNVDTVGKNSTGILAQSIGGGGGNGGYAVTAVVGVSACGVALGGDSGGGGAGGEVTVESQSAIYTKGENAYGIFAESLGGGGGVGGFTITGSASETVSHSVNVGGKGGDGGGADSTHTQKVNVTNNGDITTEGVNAGGILAQSVGGGGGAAGYNASVSLSLTKSSDFRIGGTGGSGGAGGAVTVTNNNDIKTSGQMASGILAQSVGGGGGHGGFSLSASAAPLQGAINLGGKGGDGGNAGSVDVTNNADITTGGEVAYGILAQSVGGGGGTGGYSLGAGIGIGAMNFTLGGDGSKGGYGGIVDVTNYGIIKTHAKGSHGILAQSVGGGGGAGGAATAGTMTFAFQAGDVTIPSAGLSLALGGKGGSGIDAKKVTVNNYEDIQTDMEGSNGILAQSIGGGGGDGGWAAAAAGSVSEGETVSVNVAVAHGGNGGGGGTGGEVVVNNSGTTHTKAKNSTGILAQSVGGGGGNGGLAASITMSASSEESATFNSAVSVGGSGTTAGSASSVTVKSSAAVITEEDGSVGIEAQSVGGGGGSGGASITGSIGLGKSKEDYQLKASVGGTGGGGGSAASASVALTGNGNVTTQGDQAYGVLAQSVGGGGGNGGLSFDGQLARNKQKKFNLSLGGSGGNGGSGSTVTVTSEDNIAISTAGDDAHGILAQSVGGGGGVGNLGGSGTIGLNQGEADSLNFSLSVGGSGGKGGNGGDVNVTDNHAGITTEGDNSCGILAQSIGGGGGEAGGGFTGSMTKGEIKSGSESGEEAESSLEWEMGVTVGGTGGGSGLGKTVTVNNYGGIDTAGDTSHGIFAQSIGGGGGSGGEAKDFALVLSDPSLAPEAITGMTISVGGNGGTSNNGGGVTIKNYGDIHTQGDYAKGIFAQSIGGGGGEGGATEGVSKRTTLLPSNLSITVGGKGSSGSTGGTVDVTNSGAIITSGEGAYGIQAQSIGGGGGVGGEGEVGLLKLAVGIGGAAGSGSTGGLVNVTNSGAIDTSGDGAHGIFAQSVGGGGGIAGSVARFSLKGTDVEIGIGIGWAPETGGHGGDGNKVSVINNADIITRGDSAYGILAQSVGGGGGEGGEVGYGPGAVINYLMGSVGGDGYGGAVSVKHNSGDINTLGNDSTGIFAQSAGGEDTGAPIDITVSDDILCAGTDSDGIVAQSIGISGNGNIEITIADSGTVQGGSGGTGVKFMDGASNLLKNSGTLSTLGGVNGMAVKSVESAVEDEDGKQIKIQVGNETIENYGTITGSVDLGGGANSFHNFQDATFISGSTINLGSSGSLLNNEGIINPGGSAGGTSVLTGWLSNGETGIFQTTLNSNGSCGQLKVAGMATLYGTLAVNYGSDPFTSSKTYDVLTASAVQGQFFQEINPAPLLNVSTSYLPTAVQLTVTPQSYTAVAQNSHEMVLGQYYDNVLLTAAHDFKRVLGEFQTLSAPEFKSAFASFSPAVYDADTYTSFDISRQYVRTVQERLRKVRQNGVSQETHLQTSNEKALLASNGPDNGLGLNKGENRSQQKRLGVSINGFGRFADADDAGGLSGFDYDMGGAAMGVDYALNDHMVVGAGFGYADTGIDLDGGFGSGDIDTYLGSIFGTYFVDRAYLEGVISYGDHAYDNNRRISIGDIQGYAQSNHDADAFTGLMEGGYSFSVCRLAMQPFASLFYTYLDEEDFQESGADGLNMHIGGSQTEDLTSELGLRLSQPFTTSNGILTPEFEAAWQYDFDVDRHTMPISYAGSPLGIDIKGREQSSSALLGAGLSFTTNRGITASLQYGVEIAEEFTAHGVFGQIRVPF